MDVNRKRVVRAVSATYLLFLLDVNTIRSNQNVRDPGGEI